MRFRFALLAACLFWLAYESHFSPSFFRANVEQSLAAIMGGLDTMVVARPTRHLKTAANIN